MHKFNVGMSKSNRSKSFKHSPRKPAAPKPTDVPSLASIYVGPLGTFGSRKSLADLRNSRTSSLLAKYRDASRMLASLNPAGRSRNLTIRVTRKTLPTKPVSGMPGPPVASSPPSGGKPRLALSPMRLEPSKTSCRPVGAVRCFAANTHPGLVRYSS